MIEVISDNALFDFATMVSLRFKVVQLAGTFYYPMQPIIVHEEHLHSVSRNRQQARASPGLDRKAWRAPDLHHPVEHFAPCMALPHVTFDSPSLAQCDAGCGGRPPHQVCGPGAFGVGRVPWDLLFSATTKFLLKPYRRVFLYSDRLWLTEGRPIEFHVTVRGTKIRITSHAHDSQQDISRLFDFVERLSP